MEQGQSAIGQSLTEAHEIAMSEAAEYCHFRKHAENAIEKYLAVMDRELKSRGFLLSVVKIQDEQDN